MLKNGQKHLKIYVPATNRNENPIWYSPIKYNHQSSIYVAKKMIEAYKKQPEYFGAANCLMFYYNGTSQFLHKEIL
ncbi:hypothetical protein [Polaribacter aestuariivivens]|uniref:hypothetical protein n=1 Tax=Polaribacter aestuariivivens TaxID=2304626 RepID=UPI003F495E7A